MLDQKFADARAKDEIVVERALARWGEEDEALQQKLAFQAWKDLILAMKQMDTQAGTERLRKLDGSLRTQLELPRQPSEGCLLFGSFWSSGTW